MVGNTFPTISCNESVRDGRDRPSLTLSLLLLNEKVFVYNVLLFESNIRLVQLQSLGSKIYGLYYFLAQFKVKSVNSIQSSSGFDMF